MNMTKKWKDTILFFKVHQLIFGIISVLFEVFPVNVLCQVVLLLFVLLWLDFSFMSSVNAPTLDAYLDCYSCFAQYMFLEIKLYEFRYFECIFK